MTRTAAELVWQRAALESDLLPDTCTITPRTHTLDAVGAPVDGSGTPVTSVACLVFVANPTTQAQMIGMRLADEPLWEIWIPYDDAITPDSQVTFSSDTYQVLWVEDDSSNILYRRGLMRKLS